jgi:hypothetical protein
MTTMLAACTRAPDAQLAHNDLVTLMVLGVNGVRTLRLDPAPGAQINALLPPTIEFSPTQRVQLSSPLVTPDSSYFTASPTASIEDVRAKDGVLRASVCPAALRVCKFVELPFVLP